LALAQLPGVPNPYTITLNTTRDTLVRRARLYKCLVIVVSVSVVGAGIAALSLLSLKPLLIWAYIPSWVCLFLAWDQKAVQRWRDTAVRFWSQGELEFGPLMSMLRQVPNLPQPTLEGMLASLPAGPEFDLPVADRPALARDQAALSAAATRGMIVRAVIWVLGVTVVAAACLSAR
jgi:hypothetical protein